MKFFLKAWVCALMALATFSSCGSDNDTPGPGSAKADGWMLSTWNGGTEMSGKVYLEFTDNTRFKLYQNIDEFGFRAFEGTYTRTPGTDGKEILSGTYYDGSALSDDYLIESWTDETLVLKALSDGIVSEYVHVVIPDAIRQEQPSVSEMQYAPAPRPFL